MIFSNLSFIFVFLPLLCVVYFISSNRMYRNIVLLLGSIGFYAWGEPVFIVMLVIDVVIAFYGAKIMHHNSDKKSLKTWVFIGLILYFIACLVYFKYTNFLLNTFNGIFSMNFPMREITLPLGISFFTFEILSYLIDVYRNKYDAESNILTLSTFVLFFPKIISGPIVRYPLMKEQLKKRSESIEDYVIGTKRFIVGLAKKMIISNNMALIVQAIYDPKNSNFGTSAYWLAALAYTFQIYYDFSGYSDMAIGVARMFGFKFKENFNYPYSATSITDFWKRWHISLSEWFRDYIYIPMGGNRVGQVRWMINFFTVWLVTGIWHGASFNFIVWGLYYGIVLLLERLFIGKFLAKIPLILRWLYAFILINIGWVIFSVPAMHNVLEILKIMFSFTTTHWIDAISRDSSFMISLFYIPFAFIFSFPVVKKIKMSDTAAATFVSNLGYLVLFVITLVFIVSSSFNPFIYFNF